MKRQKVLHRFLAMFLSLMLVIGMMPATVFGMQVFVKVEMSGKHITLEVEPTDQVEVVKQKVFEAQGFPPEDQILTFGGKELENGNTLQDYSIQKDSTIHLTLRSETPNVVTYIDENGQVKTLTESYTTIDSTNTPTTWTNGWYVVDGTVTINSHVTVNGDVKLILKDGVNITVNGGINVPKGSTFTVYGQDNGTGNLISTGTNGNAGIGGTKTNVNFGSIILAAKGKIVATGDIRAAGIGGGGHMNNGQPVDGTIHIYQGVIEATGGRWAAGIGGGADSITNCKITVDGGTINATGGENNVGIGGTDGSKEIIINGGNIKAYGSGSGAGIGGSYDASGGNITITGGVIDTNSIGGGSAAGGGPGGTIIISGGVVTADHIGAGGSNQEGTFSTTKSGNAVIFTSSISDQSGKDNWSGLIFEGNDGKVYGNSYILDQEITIPTGKTLTVESGKTITVANGASLNNNGTVTNNGTIYIQLGGTYIGNDPLPNPVQYQKETVSYLDYENGNFVTKYIDEYTVIDSQNSSTAWTDGWYVVKGDVTVDSRIGVTGDVKLILADNSKLTANRGIQVSDDDDNILNGSPNSLSIYAQSIGENMGDLYAKGIYDHAVNHYYHAGIGSAHSSAGIINIYGGNITAIGGGYAAGIGGAAYVSIDYNKCRSFGGGHITIYGGIINSYSEYDNKSGIGIGNAPNANEYKGSTVFETSENCNAIIYTSRIDSDNKNTSLWNGIIFEGSTGYVYGDNVTVNTAVNIPNNKSLVIPTGSTLTVSDGTTITNNGEIRVENGGSYVGEQPTNNKVTYQIDWDTNGDGNVDDTTYVSYGEIPVHDDVLKEQTDKYYYEFAGWSPEFKTVTDTAVYTAQFIQHLRRFDVTIPTGDGYIVNYNSDTNIEYGSDFTFTVNIADGYSKTNDFAVKANGTVLYANSDGSYTVTVMADTEITVEGVKDITPPENITANYKTDYFKEFLNDITFGLFFKDTVTVTISATDKASGVKEISYQLGDGELQTVATINDSITFTVEPEFIGNIKNVTATDNEGNISAAHDFEYFAVEKVAPTNVTVDTNGYASNTWTNDSVTLIVSGSTATSGIAKYQYSVDNGTTWKDMTTTEKTDATADSPLNVTQAQITVSDSVTSDYIFRAVSNAENVSALSDPVTVKIDKTAPAITIAGNTQEYLTKDIIKITATVGISNIVKVEMQKDSGDWTDITKTYKNGYTVTENGTYTLRVTNGANVVASNSITYDKIDNVKPVVVIDSQNYESDTWTNQDVTLSVSNTANNLGTTTFKYKINDGQWENYTDNIVISDETDGIKYTFKAISASKVESDEVSFNVKIDKSAPSGDIKIEENSVKNLINKITFSLFFNKNVDVIITANDTLSGVDSVKYYRSKEILTEDEVKAISDWKDYNSITETAEDTKKFVYYVKITDNVGNETYLASNGVVFDLTAPVIDKIENEQTYYVTQIGTIFDRNYKSTTVNGTNITDTTFSLAGNKEETYVITASDKAGNITTYTVKMKPIEILDDTIEGMTVENVKSENKSAIKLVKDTVEAIDLTTATDEEKQEIKNILDNCTALLTKLEESSQAGNTENIDKVENITADNVKPEDKEDLINAKEDLENALENFENNLTEEEKTELEEKLEQVNNALESIEKVESVQDAINSLPQTVEPDDSESEALIESAKEQYDKLTEHEKTLISQELKQKLEKLLKSLTDYRIISDNKIQWTIGNNTSITMTFNGPVEKFVRIEVDGKVVDTANYTVKSGSTIITLNSAYLNTLPVGKHMLTAVYSDGKASAEFEVLNKSESSVANTYDSSNIILWIVLLIVVSGILGTIVIKKQKLNNV